MTMGAKQKELTPERSVRHLFGYQMRKRRNEAGMSLETLAKILQYSVSHLQRFETADTMIPPDLPARLDAEFGTGDTFAMLYIYARKEAHPDKFRRLMELEARATTIDEYAGDLVPGLLQTEAYARELFRASKPTAPESLIDDLWAARLGRQALLNADPAPYLSVILDEAVIRRPIGELPTMREQLLSLLPLVETPASMIQVLPFAHGNHALLGGSLKLLTLDSGQSVAYEESITTGTLLEEIESVRRHRRAYDVLRSHALSPRETAAMIRDASEELAP